MKRPISMLLSILLIGFMTLSACNSEKSTTNKETEANQELQGKEYTSKYICPMHCEGSGSNETGICPVCKMDYVLNENYKESTDKN